MNIERVGPNSVQIFFRVLMIGLGAFMMMPLLLSVRGASANDGIILALVSLLPLCLIVLPALKGLFTWPVELRSDADERSLSMRPLLGPARSIAFSTIQEMQPSHHWHGGRTSFDGLILHLDNGERIVLSTGNLRSIQRIQDTLVHAGIPLIRRTSTGRKLRS